MSKPEKIQKPECRTVSSEHLRAIKSAESAAQQAHAIVGRGYAEVLALVQRAQQAEQVLLQARLKGAISVGIDPEGTVPWQWDPSLGAYVKQ